jgi:PIN domain nuclease of toxin-antitoxin system
VRLLLDTHAFLWWLAGDERLSLAARRGIAA